MTNWNTFKVSILKFLMQPNDVLERFIDDWGTKEKSPILKNCKGQIWIYVTLS